VVHLDANCHPGRARPDNVVARSQVTDVRFGSKAAHTGCSVHFLDVIEIPRSVEGRQLRAIDSNTDPARMRLAKTIVDLAAVGETDAMKLKWFALRAGLRLPSSRLRKGPP
jgi:hypothetical protein